MIPFLYTLRGLATTIGNVISIDEWAERISVPNRRRVGETLSGAEILRLVGVQSKSWDPDRFRSFDVVGKTALAALESSGVSREQIDAVIVVTCTPFELMLDQDAFRVLRELGIRDEVVPIQLGAGCAGFARACAVAARLRAEHVLIVSYTATSPLMVLPDGSLNRNYLENAVHPFARQLWASPALFSDGAAAVVLSRSEEEPSSCLYSRDTDFRSDDVPDPLIHYLGGGVSVPAGSAEAGALSCYGMNATAVKKYYMQGMLQNHRELERYRPGYDKEVARIYTHQASPALVRGFLDTVGFDPHKIGVNVEIYGNLVTPSTLRLLHEDLVNKVIDNGDEFCISVVGAGPERGAVLARVNVDAIPPL